MSDNNNPKRDRTLWSVVAVVAIFCAALSFSAPGAYAQDAKADSQRYFSVFQSAFNFILENYVDQVDPKVLYEGAMKGMAKGAVVTCTVTEVNANGIEVAVGEGMTGTIKKIDLSRERSEQRPDRFAVGEKVDAKILTVDKKKHHVTLSIKARELDEDKQALEQFGSTESGASLGDILGAALGKAEPAAKKATKKKDADAE